MKCGWEMNWEMILTLAGQSQRLLLWKIVHLENFWSVFNRIQTHDLCNAGVVLALINSKLWSHSDVTRSIIICWAHVFPWKEWWVKENVLWGVVEEWIEETFRTLAGKSQWLSNMCTWKFLFFPMYKSTL